MKTLLYLCLVSKGNYIRSSSQELIFLKVTDCIMTSAKTHNIRKKSFNSSKRPVWLNNRGCQKQEDMLQTVKTSPRRKMGKNIISSKLYVKMQKLKKKNNNLVIFC